MNIIIVSTKNEGAILRHCIDYGLDIKEKNIIGKVKFKQYISKKVLIENYIKKYNIQNSIFVDDSINTIRECIQVPNLKAYCANWGYVAEKEDGLKEEEILKIIEENE